MLFALVLGIMVGAAAVVLIQQWLTGALSDEPRRVITPAGTFIERTHERRRAA